MKLYGLLLKLYPARFREEYARPMQQQFLDDYRQAGRPAERAALWLHALRDILATAPVELARELSRDLQYSLRVYRRRAVSTTLAVIALGLAIGASTGVFSVLNALLWRSLPFSHPSRLVELWQPAVTAMNGHVAFNAWAHSSSYLVDAATFSASEMNLTGGRDALRINVAETSANFFNLLGTHAIAGRTFAADENRVAVIGYGLWQQRFGADPSIAGQTIHVNGIPLTVIGVAPAGFDYPGRTALWTPSVFDFETIPKRGAFLFETIGRLKTNVTFREAQLMFDAETRHAHPERFVHPNPDEQNRPHVISIQNQLAGPVRAASWVLAGLTLLVLLTACANIAQLLLSRTSERTQELEIRAALGASRGRLLQQLITEATFLTAAGALLGLVITYWTAHLAASIAPAPLATQDYTVLDWRVLGFAASLALAMGFLFGVLPAWLVGRLQPSGQVVRTQIGPPALGTRRVRSGLVALQAALTLCLVTSSLALGSTFLRLLHQDLGYHPAGVVTLNVSLQGTRHSGPGEWRYYSDALQRLRAVPGVESAGAINYLPLADTLYMAQSFQLESGQTVNPVLVNAVMPGYFQTVGAGFLSGSDFPKAEGQISDHPVVVNEAFARSAGLTASIVGRRITASWSQTPYRIAGVVRTARTNGPAYPGIAQIYFPVEEEPSAATTFVARVNGDPEAYLARCRDAVRALDPQVPIFDVMTLDHRLAGVLAGPRFYTTAALFLALLALLLAAVGIYGTASYFIAQRKREMGVRMAVGATYRGIRWMMLRQSTTPILIGVAAGILTSLALGRYLEHLIVSAAAPAPGTCAVAAGCLLATGLFAAWSATARVLSIDPLEAIRAE